MKKLKKSTQQNLFLLAAIGLICVLILVLFSFMMPEKPVFKEGNISNDVNASDPQEDLPVVVIDPGHGGYDEGSSSESGVVEKELNLEIALKVRDLLEENDIHVVMTRDSDEVSWSDDNVEDLQARLDIAANADALMLVSLHCNISEEDPENVRGSEIYVNTSQSDSVALAEALNAQLEMLSPALVSRGIKTGQFHLLTYNTLPCVIIEMGFLSNADDVAYLTETDTQDQLCNAIVEGILSQIKTDA